MKFFQVILYVAIVHSLLLTAHAQPYYRLPAINDTAQFGKGIGRTAWLLASSTKAHPNRVRILVYGQSISAQNWWMDVKKFVEAKFPNAQISFINKAIGGFSSERLKLMVENDVVSFYPDLILFHDYGNEDDYEQIIKVIRSRTTAEIAVQTDHMALQNQEWHDLHSEVWLPRMVKKYNLALLEVRQYWKAYLKEHKLALNDLLTDGVHLNDHGNYLLGGIIKKYFETLSTSLTADPYIRTLTAGKGFDFKKGSLVIPFAGNRVDLVWKAGAHFKAPVHVFLDQRKPSATKGCYYYTRPSQDTAGYFLRKIGQLLAMKLSDKAEEEDWALSVIWVDSIRQQLGFTVRGSVTGADGSGRSDSLFISPSGKLIIEPGFWFMAKEFANFPWLKPGDQLQWKVRTMCKDGVSPQRSAATIIQGVDNRAHRLQLKGKGLRNLHSIRLYVPPLQ